MDLFDRPWQTRSSTCRSRRVSSGTFAPPRRWSIDVRLAEGMPGRQVPGRSTALQQERARPAEDDGASRLAGPRIARTAEAAVRGVESNAPGPGQKLDRPRGKGQHDRGAVAHEGDGPIARDDGRRVGPGRAKLRDTCAQ